MSSPRKSVQEAFPDLQILDPPSSRSRSRPTSRSPTRPTSQSPSSSSQGKLSLGLGAASSTGWPNWRSMRGRGPNAPVVQYTIRLADQLREEARKLPVDPVTIISEARNASIRGGPAAFVDLWTVLERSLITLVYGSNRIESAGTSLPITIRLCQDVFRGREVTIDINERDQTYPDHAKDLAATDRKADKANVIRSRKEVVFHAKALNFLIEKILLDNKPWSESLIRQTHRILYKDLGDASTKSQWHTVTPRRGVSVFAPRLSLHTCQRWSKIPTASLLGLNKLGASTRTLSPPDIITSS